MTDGAVPLALARREAIALGAAGLAACGRPAGAAAAVLVPAGHVRDTRFPLPGPAASPGAWVEAIDGDVTALWVGRLDRAWRDPRAGAVEGMTGEDALFVLERLAWDRQRRVVLRRPVPGVRGPAPLVRWLIAPRRAAA